MPAAGDTATVQRLGSTATDVHRDPACDVRREIHMVMACLYVLCMSQSEDTTSSQPHPHTPPSYAQPPQQQPVTDFWNTPGAWLTANQMRRVIRHGVAEGVLLAWFVGALLSLLLWLGLGAAIMSAFR